MGQTLGSEARIADDTTKKAEANDCWNMEKFEDSLIIDFHCFILRNTVSHRNFSKAITMGARFSHDDVFPIIAEGIDTLVQEANSFVTHESLVQYLLQHPQGSTHVDAACEAGTDQLSREWMAGNMVAWFSKRYTEESLPCAAKYERSSDTPYGYRPRKFAIGKNN